MAGTASTRSTPPLQGVEEGDAWRTAAVHAADGRVLAPGSEPVSGQGLTDQAPPS